MDLAKEQDGEENQKKFADHLTKSLTLRAS